MRTSASTDTLSLAGASDESRELREELQRAVHPRYRVDHEIGHGGMAFVFQGWDTVDARAVAFKVLKRQHAAVLGSTRFLREIRLLSQLHHPGILPLLDSGQAGSLFYYVMPLVDGETLHARLQREPQLTVDMVRQVVSQVAAALDYAHDAGIIHRDIKPSNLFLSGTEVLVADFGIAKDLSPAEEESATSTGLVVGTTLYMSPEQAEGNHLADRRADVYSLGCVAYQMVAGEPPFMGPTPQAIVARHRATPAPSALVVRPELPAGVDPVIRKALAKSPADRYQRAGDFASALSDPAKLAAAAKEAQGAPARPRWVVPALLAVATILVVVAARFLRPAPSLSSNKVVVFPLGESPPGATQEGAGVEVALMIGSALEYTEPLEWIDGLPLLEPAVRRDPAGLTAVGARRMARHAGARWYVDGTVLRRRDSVTVVVRLNDAQGDSVVGRSSATRLAPEAAQAGLAAITQLLPNMLAPGQRIADLSALADRNPAAVASWLQGEREYRRFNFAGALEFLRRAVAADSALAVAAVRGAQAASWAEEQSEAVALTQVALRNVALLPPRLADFTRGLAAYLRGEADSAVHSLTLALSRSPQWTEAHMALGEVYYHSLPSVAGDPDSVAEREFTLAAVDTGFSLPRYHLAEIAIRRHGVATARQAVEYFIRRTEDKGARSELLPMLTCAVQGRKAVEWKRIVRTNTLKALSAAKMLSVAATYPGCAEDGFRATFADREVEMGERWGAFLGLQGVLAAEGRTTELRALVDSAVAAGFDLAPQVYLLDALAGVKVESEASAVAARQARDDAGQARLFSLWLLGEWRAAHGDRAGTEAVRAVLARRGATAPDPRIPRFVGVLGARLALLDGDSVGAIDRVRAELGWGRRESLEWELGESLAPDRLLLAELLLARHRPAEALVAAGVFDHPAPITFLPFLPASLTIRARAALALERKEEAQRYHARLAALGQSDDQAWAPSPSAQAEAP